MQILLTPRLLVPLVVAVPLLVYQPGIFLTPCLSVSLTIAIPLLVALLVC